MSPGDDVASALGRRQRAAGRMDRWRAPAARRRLPGTSSEQRRGTACKSQRQERNCLFLLHGGFIFISSRRRNLTMSRRHPPPPLVLAVSLMAFRAPGACHSAWHCPSREMCARWPREPPLGLLATRGIIACASYAANTMLPAQPPQLPCPVPTAWCVSSSLNWPWHIAAIHDSRPDRSKIASAANHQASQPPKTTPPPIFLVPPVWAAPAFARRKVLFTRPSLGPLLFSHTPLVYPLAPSLDQTIR